MGSRGSKCSKVSGAAIKTLYTGTYTHVHQLLPHIRKQCYDVTNVRLRTNSLTRIAIAAYQTFCRTERFGKVVFCNGAYKGCYANR